jgi:hypothetical protein
MPKRKPLKFEHFSPAFKAMALKRLREGEGQSELAASLKMSAKTLWNWFNLYTKGELAEDGLPTDPEKREKELTRPLHYVNGMRRIVGEASTDKLSPSESSEPPPKKSHHKKVEKKEVAEAQEFGFPPMALPSTALTNNGRNQVDSAHAILDRLNRTRLEAELAFVKADRDILQQMLKSLTEK